jgi:hypothetical protein
MLQAISNYVTSIMMKETKFTFFEIDYSLYEMITIFKNYLWSRNQ